MAHLGRKEGEVALKIDRQKILESVSLWTEIKARLRKTSERAKYTLRGRFSGHAMLMERGKFSALPTFCSHVCISPKLGATGSNYFFYQELVAHLGRKEGEVALKIDRQKILESVSLWTEIKARLRKTSERAKYTLRGRFSGHAMLMERGKFSALPTFCSHVCISPKLGATGSLWR